MCYHRKPGWGYDIKPNLDFKTKLVSIVHPEVWFTHIGAPQAKPPLYAHRSAATATNGYNNFLFLC